MYKSKIKKGNKIILFKRWCKLIFHFFFHLNYIIYGIIMFYRFLNKMNKLKYIDLIYIYI